MTARDEVLKAAQHLARSSPDGAFTAEEVVAQLRSWGTRYAAKTIRTYVASRMCAQAPGNRAVTHDDLVRVGVGRYRLK